MNFPKTILGNCPICRGQGGDSTDTTEADSSDCGEVTGQVPLVYHNGTLMCEACRDAEIAKDESIEAADLHKQSAKFRKQVGFKRVVE